MYFYYFYIVSTHLNQAVEEERSLIILVLVYVQFELTYIIVPQSVANMFQAITPLRKYLPNMPNVR